MNKLIISALMAFSVTAFAAEPMDVQSGKITALTNGQQQQSQQTSTSSASNEGVIGAIYNTPADTTSRIEYGTQKIKNTPSVSGSPLVSSNDTCMGSASGALNVPGFGIGLGKTYVDNNCMMLKNSRELWNMGMKAASMALMCNDPMNKEALELTGYECPQTTKEKKSTAQSVQASNEPTDPIIRARLGLK